MNRVVKAAVCTVCVAGVLTAAAPSASADPYAPSSDEMAWGDAYGQSLVCDAFGSNPNTEGLAQVVMTVVNQGWDQVAAGRVIGYSMGTYCPELLGPWVSATNAI